MTAGPTAHRELSSVKRALLASRLRADPAAEEILAIEPIAIVGMACRLPGGVDTTGAFWTLLCRGGDATGALPAGRMAWRGSKDGYDSAPVKGAFVDRIDRFDPLFFRTSHREAVSMDPQHRLLLEVGWEALEGSGADIDGLRGSATGVFIGLSTTDYRHLALRQGVGTTNDPYVVTGISPAVASGRLSYFFDLTGPSLTIDTACSSSLLAVHLACQSLRAGECDLSLVGGVAATLLPELTEVFARGKALAKDGRCKTFDSRADGYVRGEGCGVVVLKRLSDALADGDDVRAVVRGTAVNQDGRSAGMTAPSAAAQASVIRRALELAGLDASDLGYVEAHGTGTPLGDPIEVEALTRVLGPTSAAEPPCYLGSVKTNIGHLEGAAGIVGLIKSVLVLEHGQIPANVHFRELNPRIDLTDSRLRIATDLTPWPSGFDTRRCGVSAFGFSGTNVHLVLEEAPRLALDDAEEEAARGPFLLPLSGHTPQSLEAVARSHLEDLGTSEEGEERGSARKLRDLCFTAATCRTHHTHRLALLAHDRIELQQHLSDYLAGEQPPGMSRGSVAPRPRDRLVFVFSGHESQRARMGQELYERQPVFRSKLDECDTLMRELFGLSLLDELSRDESSARLDQVDVAQPAIFAMQVGLAALWESFGVQPSVVIGHSLGEIAAAHVAGVVELRDAVRLVCERSRLGRQLSGEGGMLGVQLSLEDATRAIAGLEDRVSVAVENSSSSTVLSGDPEALAAIAEALSRRKVFHRWLRVPNAGHCPQLDVLLPEFARRLEGITPHEERIPIYSTVTGDRLAGGAFGVEHWVRNGRDPVLFGTAVRKLIEQDHDLFLEISPHPLLYGALDGALREHGHEGTVLYSLRTGRPEWESLQETLGTLYTTGQPIDWPQVLRGARRSDSLPAYPFDRESCWVEECVAAPGFGAPGAHPLLGASFGAADRATTHYWQGAIGTQAQPFLADHRGGEIVLLPAAAMLEMMLTVAERSWGGSTASIENASFEKALVLPSDGASRAVQLVVEEPERNRLIFQLFGADDREGAEADWQKHCTGALTRFHSETNAPTHPTLDAIRARCPESVSSDEFYEAMERRGLQYGPAFQGVRELWRGRQEALARVRLDDELGASRDVYRIHPALLDAAFQVAAAATDTLETVEDDGGILLPVALGRLELFRDPGSELWSHVVVEPASDGSPGELDAHVTLLDADSRLVLRAQGLRLRPLEGDARRGELDTHLYELQWRPAPRDAERLIGPAATRSWLIFSDARGVGARLCAELSDAGHRCVVVERGDAGGSQGTDRFLVDPTCPDDYRDLLKRAFSDGPPDSVIDLWSLSYSATPEEAEDLRDADDWQSSLHALHLAQALAWSDWAEMPRLWLVTRGVHDIVREDGPPALSQSSLWGLGRVIALEHPELQCRRCDLPAELDPGSITRLIADLSSVDDEEELAYRGGERFARRLLPHRPAGAGGWEEPATRDRAFRVQGDETGTLDGLQLRPYARRAPEMGEVEIEVRAAALNFKDVLQVLGVLPALGSADLPLGWECAGVVSRAGPGVVGLDVGDDVVALAPGSLASSVTLPATLAISKPRSLGFEQAAAIPVAFMTAHQALDKLAQLQSGESVLIHAAAGGVGLAAVELARRTGARIYATAGSPHKRKLLRGLGVEHVLDSRSLDFRDEILRLTAGRGVDVVLNSLAGDAIQASLECLAPHGRFVEIGIRDIYENRQLGLLAFARNRSYFALDLASVAMDHPEQAAALMHEVIELCASGEVAPPELESFPVSRVQDAFRHLAQARHVGKVVLRMDDAQAAIRSDVRHLSPDATYLITGGLGGVGLALAERMQQRGARHFAMLGRSGASRPGAAEAVRCLEEAGAEVQIIEADVARARELDAALSHVRANMPPIRGVVHAAVVLSDGILLRTDREAFDRVMAPKARGGWNLHVSTASDPLDFFVLFSSVASVLGSPGQASYSAANSYLDTLAEHRRALGLPAHSINWGPWAEVGGAALLGVGQQLQVRGMSSLGRATSLDAFEKILSGDAAQVAVMDFDPRKWLRFYPSAVGNPLIAELAGASSRGADEPRGRLRGELLATAAGPERRGLFVMRLQERLARAVGGSAERIDPSASLSDVGIDSLLAVELRNRLEVDLGVPLSTALLFAHPTLESLVPALARRADIDLPDEGSERGELARRQSATERARRQRAAFARNAAGSGETRT